MHVVTFTTNLSSFQSLSKLRWECSSIETLSSSLVNALLAGQELRKKHGTRSRAGNKVGVLRELYYVGDS